MRPRHLTRSLVGMLAPALMIVIACAPPPAAAPPTPGAGPPATFIPPPPGCGLSSAAFCEDFEGGRNTAGNRNGDWSVAKFSLARWRSQLLTEPSRVGPAQVPACRAGSQSNPSPPGDSLVCDPSNAVQSHYGLTSTASQNYGDDSYRISQPLDIANRTGTISFDASLYTEGGLLGWPTLSYTSDPYSAPSYLAENSAGPTPRQGVQIHFNSECPGPTGWTAFPKVRVYDRYRETELHDENGLENWCTSAIATASGRLNHVEVRLSTNHLEVWMTDASNDGVHFGPLKKVFSTALNLGFSRGNVFVGVHNHATLKYAGLPSWTVLWDNIAFDGPQLERQRVSQVSDADVPSGGGMNLGYWLPDSAGSGATPALALPNVSTANVSSARLVLDMAADPISNTNWSAWRINYRFNGGPWHAAALSVDELALMPRAGSFAFSVPVEASELVNGTNTVQLSGTGFYAGYQPYIGNVDLVMW